MALVYDDILEQKCHDEFIVLCNYCTLIKIDLEKAISGSYSCQADLRSIFSFVTLYQLHTLLAIYILKGKKGMGCRVRA